MQEHVRENFVKRQSFQRWLPRFLWFSSWNENWPLQQSFQMELLLICQDSRVPSPRRGELPFSFSTFNVSKFHQLWIKVKGKLIFDLKVYSHETFLCIHGNVTTTSQPNCANPVLHQKNDNSSLLYNTKHTGRTQPFKDTLWFPKMFLFSFLYSTSGSKELYISIEVEEGIQCLSLASITVGLGVGWPTITQLPAQALQST